MMISPAFRVARFRLVRQGAARLALLVLTLILGAGSALGQSDTTRPAISLNAADGSTTLRSLPAPLRGTVYDAGGMGGLLAVRFYRNHNGNAERWTGSAWADAYSPDAYWMATVTASGNAGTYNWSANVPWPSGANLPAGTYNLGITAVDNANNRSDIGRTVVIGAPDTTAPALQVQTPVSGALVDIADQDFPVITGTVNDGDGVGVAYAQISIARLWNGVDRVEYWNGSSWGGGYYLRPTLEAPDAAGARRFSLSANLPPRAQLATGLYLIDVLAYDLNGNRAVTRHYLQVAPIDTTAPNVSITFPAAGQQIYRLPEIRGTATDVGSGISDMRVWMQRTVSEAGRNVTEYWNGASWGRSFSYAGILPSRSETGWTRNQNLPAGANLPPGQYLVLAHALDRYNNVGAAYRNFNIVPVPPLSIDAHLRADNSQAWLGEGFTNADASGQTLAGTIQRGQIQTRQFRLVRYGGLESKTVKVTIADWAAFAAAGWTASFRDEGSGADISAQITSAQGWRSVFNDGDAREIVATITAPANVTAGQTGALTLRVEADPTSETPAIDVVKATWMIIAPAPDLAINVAGGAWQGENVRNQDGANQTVERVAGSSHVVRGQIKLSVSDAPDGQRVRWSVPDWDAFRADSWQARFFDATQGGLEITGQLAGEGWISMHTANYQPIIRWEVTVPATARDLTRTLSVRAQTEGGSAVDVVKASVRVLPAVQPDVAVSALDENGLPGEWTGAGELSPTPQSLAGVWGASQTKKFALRVTNQGSAAAQFQFEPPSLPAGWELKFYDDLAAGDLLEVGAEGLATPAIAPGASLQWRAELTAGADATATANLALRWSGGTLSDEVEIKATLQKLAKLQWSGDGTNWQDVTPQTSPQIEQYATVGVRGVKSVPNAPWPDTQPVGPIWRWGDTKAIGKYVWVKGRELRGKAGDQVSAYLGSESKSLRLSVKPVLKVALAVAKSDLLAGEGPQNLNSTDVTVAVSTPIAAFGEPAKVRLRATNEYGQSAGKWNGANAPHVDVTIAMGSSATVNWVSGPEGGQIEFEATVLDEDGTPRDSSDTAFVQTHKPYAQTRNGNWQENNGVWSRTITASTWFQGQKLGGVGVALVSQIKDYETQQPAPGWTNAAPFDATTGTTDADGKFSTVQRWNPVEAGAWPHDFEVEAEAQLQ